MKPLVIPHITAHQYRSKNTNAITFYIEIHNGENKILNTNNHSKFHISKSTTDHFTSITQRQIYITNGDITFEFYSKMSVKTLIE